MPATRPPAIEIPNDLPVWPPDPAVSGNHILFSVDLCGQVLKTWAWHHQKQRWADPEGDSSYLFGPADIGRYWSYLTSA